MIYILSEKRVWNSIVLSSFLLRQSSDIERKRDQVTLEEWEDTVEVFS